MLLDDEGLAASGLPTMTVEAQPALTATFPYLSFASIFLAILKVYPALERELQKVEPKQSKHLTVVEVYDKVQRVIEYYAITQPRDGFALSSST